MKNPTLTTWVTWIAAIMVAAFTLSSFAFGTFQTKDDARETKSDIVKALDEIKAEQHEIHAEIRELARASK